MEIIKIPETGYASNSYIVFDTDSKKAVIIDPSSDIRIYREIVGEHELQIEKIILTHGHCDHIYSIHQVRDEFKVPVLVHEADAGMIADGDDNFSNAMYKEAIEIEADETMKDGDLIKIHDGFEFKVIHTPGHTKGGVCLKIEDIIITGDTIFLGSIGRTDFPGGDFDEIIDSIKNKILIYDEDTILLPGHGPQTKIGYEKVNNPFLR